MDILQAALLGIIQGLTEWLPISSSAHLALAQYFLGIKTDVSFDIILHLGTLLAVLIYYAKDLLALAHGVLKRESNALTYAALLLLCTIPTAIIGLAFKDFFESMFTQPLLLSCALAITGIFLIIANRAKGEEKVTTKSSLLIGIAQGIAVAPGISRSGATIGTALLLGINREEAARFSFLGGVIPILGAVILEGRHALVLDNPLPVVVGFCCSLVVGYLSIGILLRLLKKSKLNWFGFYCIALAALAAIAYTLGIHL